MPCDICCCIWNPSNLSSIISALSLESHGPWVIYALRPPTCALSKSAENVLSDLWGADPTISDQAEYLLSDPYY